MKHEESHFSDQQLLLDVEGELSASEEGHVRAHLDACWQCRARRQELAGAITDFARAHTQEFDAKLPPAAGPRALLRALIAEVSATERNPRWRNRIAWTLAAAACAVLALSSFLVRLNSAGQSSARPRAMIVTVPDSKLTPGATVLVSRLQVCGLENTKNKTVPVTLQRKVFEEYGIADAQPDAYEVDYLVTPALGGADDIHNLWPQSYSATVWNAHVKDALEDRLRDMVCDGSMDLAAAQQEIAVNWIAAYKRHFHTDTPLAEHVR